MAASIAAVLFLITLCIFLYYYLTYILYVQDFTPVLLWWTNSVYPHIEDKSRITCKLGECVTTKARSILELMNVDQILFIFYGTDFNENDIPSLRHHGKHLWALLHEESPMNNYMFSHLLGISLFNFTSTFSRNSDFPLTTLHIPNLEYLTERKPIPLSIKNDHRLTLAPILYIQSNCDVPSARDAYISELSKHIAIDSYGKCLHNKELPVAINSNENFNDDEFLNLIAKYKFHLAYENAICEDYLSEKLFRAFHVGSVPIYKGDPRVMDWVPTSHSIILIDDFSSPADLAKFIALLDSNDTLYKQFLNFKSPEVGVTNRFMVKQLQNRKWSFDGGSVNFVEDFECYLCDQLIQNYYKPTKIPKIANNSHFGCPPPVNLDLSTSSERLKSQSKIWTEIYRQSRFKAASILQKLDKLFHNNFNNTKNMEL